MVVLCICINSSLFGYVGNYLAVAVDIGRVLIQAPVFAPMSSGAQWRFFNPLCYNKADNTYILNMYCYYEPYSKCSYTDIFPDYNTSNPYSWPEDKIPIFEFDENLVQAALKKNAAIMNEKVIRFKHRYNESIIIFVISKIYERIF
jgi:hypothetical protein